MKKYIVVLLLTIACCGKLWSQPNKKPAKQPATGSQPDMNKMLEEAMKNEGMSKEEQEEMMKLMKGVMPGLADPSVKVAYYPEFTSNKALVPARDPARATALQRKALTQPEIAAYANNLYAKVMTKGDATQMALVKKLLVTTTRAADIGAASVLAMLQGHPQAALALSFKAVAADPSNANWQNNMAALLSSYGYPEQAMPVLRKLQREMPGNSTVLNNIGQAWLAAGQTDSAARYFRFATRVNPTHHEAQCGIGLAEEINRDPKKAGQTYEEAMGTSVNPFVDQLRKNNGGKNSSSPLDFEKIKRNIAIYEYFKKDWIPVPPPLHNDVRYYEEDYATIKAWEEMVSKMSDRIQEMTTTLSSDLTNLAEKGEEAFVKEMLEENMKGVSFMSKPAALVIAVLSQNMQEWQDAHIAYLKYLADWKTALDQKREAEISAIYKKLDDSKGITCAQFKQQLDGIENEYMRQVNTRLRDTLINKAERFREWMNAWCTWSWYMTGNVKNVILIQCLNFTLYLTEVYASITTAMEVRSEHCGGLTREVTKKVDEPPIPNFACPAVVSIPTGPEWQELAASVKNLNDNPYQIQQGDQPVPNLTVAYGTGGQVAQPGMAPSIKTAGGTIAPGAMNTMDDELVPLPKLPRVTDEEELTPIPFYLAEVEKAKQAREKARSKMVKDLMSQLLESDCNDPKKNRPDPKIKMLNDAVEDLLRRTRMQEPVTADPKLKMLEQATQALVDRTVKDLVKDALEAYKQFLTDKDPSHFNSNMQAFDRILDQIGRLNPAGIDQVSKGMQLVNNMKTSAIISRDAPAVLNEVRQNGLQPTISSGIQVPGTFKMPGNLFQ